MFRGREVTHPERGTALLDQLADELSEIAVVEQSPLQDGRNMTMMLAPSKAVLAGETGRQAGRGRPAQPTAPRPPTARRSAHPRPPRRRGRRALPRPLTPAEAAGAAERRRAAEAAAPRRRGTAADGRAANASSADGADRERPRPATP